MLDHHLTARRYVNPEEIEICRSEDGSEWLLGKGNYGRVRACRALKPFNLILTPTSAHT